MFAFRLISTQTYPNPEFKPRAQQFAVFFPPLIVVYILWRQVENVCGLNPLIGKGRSTTAGSPGLSRTYGPVNFLFSGILSPNTDIDFYGLRPSVWWWSSPLKKEVHKPHTNVRRALNVTIVWSSEICSALENKEDCSYRKNNFKV